MAYDPLAAGSFSVERRSGVLVDGDRADRRLPFDVWVSTEASGSRRPLVLFSHPSFGHRRQAAALLDHLAGHGYVVAAVDHTGNATGDLAARQAGAATRSQRERDRYIADIIADRVPDLRFLADSILEHGAGGVAAVVDPVRIGLVGWSFGGWAVLAVPEVDARAGAVVAMAPAGSSTPQPGIIPATLSFAWSRDVPVLYLAGERDPYTPVEGIVELVGRTPSPARCFVLVGAGHDHFGDTPQDAPPSLEDARAFTHALTLAHLDATLRGSAEAAAFLQSGAIEALERRGVPATRIA